jgi:hypothetical protein
VKLTGTFYPSRNGREGSSVLLLHRYRGGSSDSGWSDLAKELQGQGFAVLSFDFRGHGASKDVDTKRFWDAPFNRGWALWRGPVDPNKVWKGANLPSTIKHETFNQTNYPPVLINDIAAAKLFLDSKAQVGECNSTNLCLIGAEEGATLGALWITGKHTPKLKDRLPKLTGDDVICAVWLSISPNLGWVDADVVSNSLAIAQKKTDVPPMAFVCGKDDSYSGFANRCFKSLNPDPKDKFTVYRPVESAPKVRGHALLDQYKTRELILTHLRQVIDQRPKK